MFLYLYDFNDYFRKKLFKMLILPFERIDKLKLFRMVFPKVIHRHHRNF